jgi:ribosome recycling factor
MVVPHLTEERRRELVKVVRRIAEEKRVAVRSVRRDAIEQFRSMEKEGAITEDDLKRAQDEIQKITDKYISEIDKTLAEKEVEIMQV